MPPDVVEHLDVCGDAGSAECDLSEKSDNDDDNSSLGVGGDIGNYLKRRRKQKSKSCRSFVKKKMFVVKDMALAHLLFCIHFHNWRGSYTTFEQFDKIFYLCGVRG